MSNEMERSLGRIEGKLDSLAVSVLEHIQDDKVNFKELGVRVSVMEKKMYTFIGALGLLWAGITYFKV